MAGVPAVTPALSLANAQRSGCCRFCETPFHGHGKWIIDYGEEFSCKSCYEEYLRCLAAASATAPDIKWKR